MSEVQLNMSCPDDWTLSRFVENRLNEPQAGDVLAHVAGCAKCRSKVSGLAKWLEAQEVHAPSEEARALAHKVWLRAQWRRVAEYFKPKAAFLAAADGQTADELGTKNALGSGFIHFLSRTPRGLKEGWHIKLSIPAFPTEKLLLNMTVLDGTDDPIASATLRFCHQSIKVVNGKAYLSLKDFQQNMNEAFISVQREDGSDIPGDPVLGYDLMK